MLENPRAECRPILVIDDDEDLRSSACEVLESEGFQTLQACNGKEALDLVLGLPVDQRPSCLVLDLMMPVMDGRAFLENLVRLVPEHRTEMSVLVWTAKGGAAREIEELPLKCEILRKPVDIDDLIRSVESHCHPAQAS